MHATGVPKTYRAAASSRLCTAASLRMVAVAESFFAFWRVFSILNFVHSSKFSGAQTAISSSFTALNTERRTSQCVRAQRRGRDAVPYGTCARWVSWRAGGLVGRARTRDGGLCLRKHHVHGLDLRLPLRGQIRLDLGSALVQHRGDRACEQYHTVEPPCRHFVQMGSVFGGWGTPEIPLTAMAMSPSQPAANMVSSLTMYISWDMTIDKHKHSISAALPATGVETGVWTA